MGQAASTWNSANDATQAVFGLPRKLLHWLDYVMWAGLIAIGIITFGLFVYLVGSDGNAFPPINVVAPV